MPYGLDTHVLTVDANVIHKVDTANPQNLYSMWTVFSRCAESVEQGRRLENLSWRLWNRETICSNLESNPAPTSTTLPRDIPSDLRIPDVPPLSGSVDSASDEDAVVDYTPESAPVDIRPRIQRQNSCASSRGRGSGRHITSDDFEKMVVSIIQEKEPLTAPLPQIALPFLPPPKPVIHTSTFEPSGSTTTESPSKASDETSETSQPRSSPEFTSRTMVVRGFSPSAVPIVHADSTERQVSSPESLHQPRPVRHPARTTLAKKQPPVFKCGGSASSSEACHSPEIRKPMLQPKRKMFKMGASSEEESSPRSVLLSGRAGPLTSQKKQTSFSNHVTTRTIATDVAVDDQSETDDMDESAIDDDDDSSEWEDSIEDSGKSSVDDKSFFQRVDSSANLSSRRSLITLMIEQDERARKLGNVASHSTSALPRSRTTHNGPCLGVSPNDSDDTPLMMKNGMRPSPLKPINEIPRSAAQPIFAATTQVHHQAALSPRTTRKNMLATELTESLRRHLLWERQQKSSTANAVLKRRHTSQDVANLKQYPEKPYMNKNEDCNASSWNQYLAKEVSNGYHSKGW